MMKFKSVLTVIFILFFGVSLVSAEPRFRLKIIEARSFSGIIEKELQVLVVSDKNRFFKLYKKIRSLEFPVPSSPTINFEKQIVLMAFMGGKPTPGYTITFDKISFQHEQILEIIVKITRPPPGEILAQVMTSPYVVARIGRGTYNTVNFRDENEALLKSIKVE